MTDVSSPSIFKESAVIVMEEHRRTNDQSIESGRRLDDKAVSLLEWSSVALVIASALELTSGTQSQLAIPLLVLLAGAVVLYLAIVVLCLKALWPQDYHNPVSIDWDELYRLYFGKEEAECLTQTISSYMAAIEFNTKRTTAKAQHVRQGFRLLPVLILVLVFLATRGLWQGLSL